MSQPKLTLYHFPGACSQVAVCALELAGLEYQLELINLASGQQSTNEFLEISPLGKIPLLAIDSEPLGENAAILTYIAALRPEAGIFPVSNDPRTLAEAVGGMSFCGGTLHPIVRGLANPQRMTTGDGAPVREKSTELANKSFKQANKRVAEHGWWLGQWSIVDVYLNWAFSVAQRSGFATANFPELERLAERMREQPAFVRMEQVDMEARIKLGL